MERALYSQLLQWKAKQDVKPLLLLGGRQVGKTYLMREFCNKEYCKVVEVNLFNQPGIVELYNSTLDSNEKFEQLKLIVNANMDSSEFKQQGILFIDEIQESEALISELKFFREEKPGLRVVCSGSLLGVRLKRLSRAFPVGQIEVLRLYPLNFAEFLQSTDNLLLHGAIEHGFATNNALSPAVHEKALNLYRSFLCLGGMPEVINAYLYNGKDLAGVDRQIIRQIASAYFADMNKYVNSHSESNRIESTYRSVPAQMLNASKKFQYAKIDSSARARSYTTALDWLIAADMVVPSTAVSQSEIPLNAYISEGVFKLYLSDTGFLVSLVNLGFADIMTNQNFSFKGALAENYVACELAAKGVQLHYWRSGNRAEIDFLLEGSMAEDGIIPVEVKADKNVRAPSLAVYNSKFNPKYAIRVSTKNFGFENHVKSVPLYAVFCLG
jgi:predicted AAA+ superfamily ATPase